MHRTRIVVVGVVALLALLCSSALQDPRARPQQAPVATVIFVRHAEAGPRSRAQPNPDLTEKGNERAKVLGRTLRAAGVTKVFATDYARTQQTAGAIAKAVGKKVETYEARDSSGFAEQLSKSGNGEVVVVVGHSNTVPVLVKLLGGKLADLTDRGWLRDDEHDRMIVLTLAAPEVGEPLRCRQTLDLRVDP